MIVIQLQEMQMANQNRIRMIQQYLLDANARELSSVAYRSSSIGDLAMLERAVDMLKAACKAPPTRDPCVAVRRVKIVSCGDKKIQVIKAIRAMTSLGLKEAKVIADTCDVVKEVHDPEEAFRIKAELEAAGATVELIA